MTTVLYVDSSRTLRLVGGNLLRREGHRVYECETPEEAVMWCEGGASIRCVIINIVRTEECRGVDLARWLALIRPDLKITVSCMGERPDDLPEQVYVRGRPIFYNLFREAAIPA